MNVNSDIDIPDLQNKLKQSRQNSKLKIIKKLKFQNTIFQAGDDIRIRQNFQSNDECYGKIILIAQSQLTQFPVLLILWYYSPTQQIISSIDQYGLSNRELVLSSDTDWQYIQAVKGKIIVMNQNQYKKLDQKQQQRQNLFICRSILDKKNELIIASKRQCFCQQIYNSLNSTTCCIICGRMFHQSCSGRQDRCNLCHF